MYSPEYISTIAILVSIAGVVLGIRNEFLIRRLRFSETKRGLTLSVTRLKIQWQESKNLLYHCEKRIKKEKNAQPVIDYLSQVDVFLSCCLKNLNQIEGLLEEIKYGKVKEAFIHDQTSTIIKMHLNIESNNKEMVKKLELLESAVSETENQSLLDNA